jgi:hypothetical protein
MAACAIAFASDARAQAPAALAAAPIDGFVSGPLTWAPTLELRDAGVDSNVFNSSNDPQQDTTGSALLNVDSQLRLRYLQISTHSTGEYAYFQRYKNQRALNGLVNSRLLIPWHRFQPTALVAFTRAKERSSNELDVRAPREDRALGAGFIANVAQRFSINAEVDRLFTRYDFGTFFRDVEIGVQLNHQTTSAVAGVHVTLTPFTSIFFEGGASRDEFDIKPLLNTNNVRGAIGFSFSPDAVIGGQATIGYHEMRPEHPSTVPDSAGWFTGVTANVNLTYTVLGRTRFTPHILRDANYSVSPLTPYYVSTASGLDILQTLFGPIDLLLRGSYEKLAYPATVLAPARTDRAYSYGGGLSIRLANQGRIAINYDASERRSFSNPDFDYSRRHLYTTITYGF